MGLAGPEQMTLRGTKHMHILYQIPVNTFPYQTEL